jgi:hypothetical protein
MIALTKLKKFSQRKASAGWNQHVNKYQKRVANRVMRRWFADELEGRKSR